MNDSYWMNDQPDYERSRALDDQKGIGDDRHRDYTEADSDEIGMEASEGDREDLAGLFQNMTDEEVVALCHQGDDLAEEYLLDKYKNFVRSKARSYFLLGADHEDIVQEGMIGLYKAIRDYRQEKLSSFHAFAELCVTRQIITAIKTASRQKHIPLNSYISLNKPLFDEESDRTLLDVLMEGRVSNPEEILINREDLISIHEKINEVLSGLEQDVLNAYLDGMSYQEIADELGRHVKSIDNALQRVKRKLEKYLYENVMAKKGDKEEQQEGEDNPEGENKQDGEDKPETEDGSDDEKSSESSDIKIFS